MKQIRYNKRPIGSIDALGRALSEDGRSLVRLAEKADRLYYIAERKKKDDGSTRNICGVRQPLYDIHQRIVRTIFRHVDFPLYLHGSIWDKENPRSAITDARVHLEKQLVVHLDIENFFPSVEREVVFVTWQRLFNFPEDVAEVLTGLTTRKGFLPQGAPTSSGLSNMIFWDQEPRVEQRLAELGFTYTRYVDDVTISTDHFVRMSELQQVFSIVIGMFSSKGVRPHRNKNGKTDQNWNKMGVVTPGYRRQVHGLNVGGGVLTLDRRERAKIRAAVHRYEHLDPSTVTEVEYVRQWLSIYGRIEWLRHFHPVLAEKYYERMNAIRPVLSENLPFEVKIGIGGTAGI